VTAGSPEREANGRGGISAVGSANVAASERSNDMSATRDARELGLDGLVGQ
jgi:hypothetical protein